MKCVKLKNIKKGTHLPFSEGNYQIKLYKRKQIYCKAYKKKMMNNEKF